MDSCNSRWDLFISSNDEPTYRKELGIVRHPKLASAYVEATASMHDYLEHKDLFESRVFVELGSIITPILHENKDTVVIPRLSSHWFKPEELYPQDKFLCGHAVRIFRVRCNFYTLGGLFCNE